MMLVEELSQFIRADTSAATSLARDTREKSGAEIGKVVILSSDNMRVIGIRGRSTQADAGHLLVSLDRKDSYTLFL